MAHDVQMSAGARSTGAGGGMVAAGGEVVAGVAFPEALLAIAKTSGRRCGRRRGGRLHRYGASWCDLEAGLAGKTLARGCELEMKQTFPRALV